MKLKDLLLKLNKEYDDIKKELESIINKIEPIIKSIYHTQLIQELKK